MGAAINQGYLAGNGFMAVPFMGNTCFMPAPIIADNGFMPAPIIGDTPGAGSNNLRGRDSFGSANLGAGGGDSFGSLINMLQVSRQLLLDAALLDAPVLASCTALQLALPYD